MDSPQAEPLIVVTIDHLGRLGAAQPHLWQPLLAEHCGRHAINTPRRLSAFLSNGLHETGGFTRLVENLNYRADRIAKTWPSRFPTIAEAQPFARKPEALAERVYGGRLGNLSPGDGFRYRGRGLLQTTGRDNYARLGIATGLDLVRNPELIEQPALAVESACRFWAWRGCGPVADRGDITAVRRMINGGLIGIDDVTARYARALKVLGGA